MSIPIVDALGQIIEWTDETPRITNGRVRHARAATLLGAELSSAYIEFKDPNAVIRAGAPAGWKGPWRCMAICPPSLASRLWAETPV